jgi:ribosomal protein S18 acetylase RimI-like enzyme
VLRLVIASPELARRYRTELIGLLQTTVGNGAPLGFFHPLSMEDAGSYWDGAIASLARAERVLILALAEERVVGMVQLEFASKQNARHRAEVQKIAVLPAYRRSGVGHMLMAAVETEARRAGRTLLVLDTREGGMGEAFCGRLGWIRSGRIPAYVRDEDGTPHATILFHKELDGAS